jgi:hypothetical protein
MDPGHGKLKEIGSNREISFPESEQHRSGTGLKPNNGPHLAPEVTEGTLDLDAPITNLNTWTARKRHEISSRE